MRPGDLVKRKDTFKEWLKAGNSWMTLEEEQEIGIMLENDEGYIVIHWPFTGISWEDADSVEKVG